jgi:diguanylate cyclase (GGDEF)-like protein
MRILIRVTTVLFLLVALAVVFGNREELAWAVAYAPEIALVVIAVLIGAIVGTWRTADRATGDDTTLSLSTGAITSETPASSDPVPERGLLSFASQLLAATTTNHLQSIVESQLSVLLQGRRVWIVWGGQQPEAHGVIRQHGSALIDTVQEWTTFGLIADGHRQGVVGVESAGGLPIDLRQRVQSMTPLIAQALRTAHEVNAFREASVVDLLTGAATRREGLSRLQAEVKRAQRAGSTMAVLMIDLDHFKAINDQFGHALGDDLLTAIGQTLVRSLRATDVRCRWGGEEFLIVLPETSLAQAQVVAVNLLNNVAATAVPSSKGPVSSTASIGLTVSRPAETDVNRIVGRADMALYQAKHAGRGCVRVVLSGLDGEPLGVDTSKKPAPRTADKLPFPDRRDPNRRDRRRLPGPGRRSTDPHASTVLGFEELFVRDEDRRLANG